MDLATKIEGVLFYKAGPVKKKELAKLFGVKDEELNAAFEALTDRLNQGATRLLITEKEVQLVTAPELDSLIEDMRKEELKRDIGKAGAETLAIVLYREPVSRAEIDSIRAVNSAFILRNLMIRGLISRETNPQDSRSFCYRSTPELLAHLGVSKKQDLENYQSVMDNLDRYLEEQTKQEPETESLTA